MHMELQVPAKAATSTPDDECRLQYPLNKMKQIYLCKNNIDTFVWPKGGVEHNAQFQMSL